MGIVFWLTFNVIGAGLQSLLETGIGYLTEITDQAMTSAGVNTAVHSLVIDGIFNGVGGVLVSCRSSLHCFSSYLCWKTADIWQE